MSTDLDKLRAAALEGARQVGELILTEPSDCWATVGMAIGADGGVHHVLIDEPARGGLEGFCLLVRRLRAREAALILPVQMDSPDGVREAVLVLALDGEVSTCHRAIVTRSATEPPILGDWEEADEFDGPALVHLREALR